MKAKDHEIIIRTWRDTLSSRLDIWKQRFQKVGTTCSLSGLYAFFLAETAWPVLQSFYQGHAEAATVLLSQIIGSVGANLISGQIEKWKNEGGINEADILDNSELLKYLDIFADKLGALEILGQNLKEIDKSVFHDFVKNNGLDYNSVAIETYIKQSTTKIQANKVECINIGNQSTIEKLVVVLPKAAQKDNSYETHYHFSQFGLPSNVGDTLTYSIKKTGQSGTFEDGRLIYFAYGDSELQYALYGVGNSITYQKYLTAMEEALRLLLVFKPWHVPVVIAASSFVQSKLTASLLTKYSCFTDISDPHIFMLRRESDWKIYFEKREKRYQKLRHVPRYLRNYDKTVRDDLSSFPVLNTDVYAGIECSKVWLSEIMKRRLYDPLNPSLDYQRLSDFREELVEKETFTWESLRMKLVQQGFEPSKEWEFEGQRILAQSYLQMRNDLVQLPSGIALNNELWVQNHDNFYTNTRLLRNILRLTGVENEFIKLEPKKLLSLLSNADFIEIKSKLSLAKSPDAARKLVIGMKKEFNVAMAAVR